MLFKSEALGTKIVRFGCQNGGSPKRKHSHKFSLALRPKQLQAAAVESAFLLPATARLQVQYRKIKCPVQLIHGDADQLIENEQTVRLHRVLARSDMRLVPQAGHMVHYADPEAISRAIHDWRQPILRFAGER